MNKETEVDENVQQSVPFFAVSNMEVLSRYYVEGLGFEITLKWVVDDKLRWCWLQRGGAALMLQEFPTEGHNSFVAEGEVGEGVSINFICKDALVLYHEFINKGIEASIPFVGNGMWVTGMTDPDGYKLFFESNTDVPEETVYTDYINK